MPGETVNIADIAEKVAKDIFEPFGWSIVEPRNLNFKCAKPDKHKKKKPSKGNFDHEHPCDLVLKYFDPYLDKNIFVLTDLKSFSKPSFSLLKTKNSLVSLAMALECAHVSSHWQGRYLDDKPSEIRGMLFLVNHDKKYLEPFGKKFFKGTRIDDIPLMENQQLHLMGPEIISYLATVLADLNKLKADGEFPHFVKQYSFFYPEMTINKIHGEVTKFPGIIEVLCGPFMVIRYDEFLISGKTGSSEVAQPGGYVIYYRNDGDTDFEFMYLFDYLSKWQILSSTLTIKLRIASNNPNPDIKSHFRHAKNKYLYAWGGDDFRKRNLERVELELVSAVVPHYVPEVIGWRDQ